MNKGRIGPPRFLFLEFLDAEINTLLTSLRRTFADGETNSGIHITVRGPYYDEISGTDIVKFERIVKRDPILIHGIDIFENPGENIVYIRVHSNALKEIWWKPDFPKEKFGFNPHISLSKSSDLRFALTVSEFLKKEEIKLVCHDFRLVPFSSRQLELFPFESVPEKPHFDELSKRRLVKPDVLQRATRVVEEYRRKVFDINVVHAT